jgi:CHASE2 domain-containing sensor protein
VEVVVGALLLLLGAVGATVTARRLEEQGRMPVGLLAVAPMGLLIGAGAALVRGWDLVASMLLGAVAVPLVATVARVLEVRRTRRGGRA